MRTTGIGLSLCLLVFLFCGTVACQRTSGDTGQKTLHYFTWSDYVGPELLAEFERRHGVRVVVDTFSSNEELLAKLQGGAGGGAHLANAWRRVYACQPLAGSVGLVYQSGRITSIKMWGDRSAAPQL